MTISAISGSSVPAAGVAQIATEDIEVTKAFDKFKGEEVDAPTPKGEADMLSALKDATDQLSADAGSSQGVSTAGQDDAVIKADTAKESGIGSKLDAQA